VSEPTPAEYVVAAAPSPATIAAVAAWLAERNVALADLRAGRQTLEDVFLRLTAEPGEPRQPRQPRQRDTGDTGEGRE
jgi:ABC-2 type transport system ATP-binding protein